MKRWSSLVLVLLILIVVIGGLLKAVNPLYTCAEMRTRMEPTSLGQIDSFGSAQAETISTVRLYGYVTDLYGSPVPQAYADLYDDKWVRLDLQATDSEGHYEFFVPRYSLYRIILTSLTDRGDYQVFWYIPVAREIRPGDASEVRTNIALRPSASLILNAYDATGNLLRNAAFKTMSGIDVYATDLTDLPRYGWFSAISDSSTQGNWDLAVPAFAVPTQTPIRLHVPWEVPDFGKVILDLDDEGLGYTVPNQGGYLVLNFNYEVAKSQLAALRRDTEAFRAQGYPLTDAVQNGIQSSEVHLRNGESYMTQSPPALSIAIAELNLSLRDTLWTHEELHLQRARFDIERNRKGSVRLRVLGNGGQPISGARVDFHQVSHDFLFGAQPMGNWANRYLPPVAALMREAGLNYAPINASWGALEPSPGFFDWSWIDQDQNAPALLDQGFQVMGHVAFWLFRSNPSDYHYCPQYQDTMSFPDLQSNASDHMRSLAARYRGRIDLWEINEQNLRQSNALNLTWDQKIELARSAIAGMKAGNPEAKTLVNSGGLPYGDYVEKLESTAVRAGGISFDEYLGLLATRGIDFDSIGLELYHWGIDSDGNSRPGLSLASLSYVMDRYADYCKPIFIQEVSAPSFQYPGSYWWHRPWDEATQAEFLEKFYTLAFSKPLVKGIVWSYGVSDDESFIKSGGVLDADMKPKAAYFTLKNLIASWTTSAVGTTDENGALEFRGFAGDYVVTITTANGYSFLSKLHIYEQQQIESTIMPIYPNDGTVGTEISIVGSGFGAGKNKVLLGTTSLKILEWNDGLIRASLTKAVIQGTYDVTVFPKGASLIIFPKSFNVRLPEIDAVFPNVEATNGEIILQGFFFGSKRGKVTLAGKNCSVLKWTMVPSTGQSKVRFVLPRGLGSGGHELKITNDLGSDTTMFTIF